MAFLFMSLQRLFADAEVLENMMKNLIARYRLTSNLPYMQDGLTQIRRQQVRRQTIFNPLPYSHKCIKAQTK